MTRALGIAGLVLSWSLAALGAEPWTLERALQQALAANPDARLAQQRIAAAQAGLEQANAAFWPRVQFQSSYTGSDNPMLAFGSILNQRAYSSSLNFNDVPSVDDLNARGLVTVPALRGRQERRPRAKRPAPTPRPPGRTMPPSATPSVSRCPAPFTRCSRRGSSSGPRKRGSIPSRRAWRWRRSASTGARC